MGDIGSDTTVELGRLIGSYVALKKKDPKHDLLALCILDEDRRGLRFTPAYAPRYVRADDPWRVHSYARYTASLKAAVARQPVQLRDIGSDTTAELGMLIDAYIALKKKDPQHDLLALCILDDDRRGLRFTPAYAPRCVRADDPWRVHGYARYTAALKAAVAGQPIQLLDTQPACEF